MRSLIRRDKIYAADLYLKMPIVYSNEYVDAWDNAYMEGREDYADYRAIVTWEGFIVGLTLSAGIVTVVSGPEGISYKQIHIDNLAYGLYLEDDDE